MLIHSPTYPFHRHTGRLVSILTTSSNSPTASLRPSVIASSRHSSVRSVGRLSVQVNSKRVSTCLDSSKALTMLMERSDEEVVPRGRPSLAAQTVAMRRSLVGMRASLALSSSGHDLCVQVERNNKAVQSEICEQLPSDQVLHAGYSAIVSGRGTIQSDELSSSVVYSAEGAYRSLAGSTMPSPLSPATMRFFIKKDDDSTVRLPSPGHSLSPPSRSHYSSPSQERQSVSFLLPELSSKPQHPLSPLVTE